MRVNDKLEWTQYSDLSHEDWFKNLHNGEEVDYEDIDRGYIKVDTENNICNITMYKGKNFRCIQLSDELLKNGKSCPDDLRLLAVIYAGQTNHEEHKMKFKVCNGVKVEEPGEIWEPLKVVETFEVDRIKDSRNNISLKQVINYEDALVELHNGCVNQLGNIGNKESCKQERFILNEIKLVQNLFKAILNGNVYDKMSYLAERIAMVQHMKN